MELKVMTFNIRVDCPNDGINLFPYRKPKIYEAIISEDPDVIGFQEATEPIRTFLRESLTEYVVVGCGRNADQGGEGVCIAYKRDLFELIYFNTFWLSDTPEIPGSIYENTDQSIFPRMTVVAKLRSIENGKIFNFFNTHLDHKGEQARLKGMKQIFSEIEASGGDFVLVGDMNATPDSECIATALSFDGVIDATADVGGTFHNFGRRCCEIKIDYIFTNGRSTEAYRLSDEHKDGVYISDHYPVCAVIKL